MLGFTAPAWLVALAALALPIALHLWSHRPRQVVRIGSLRHLRGPVGPRAWGRRLDDLPLLSLRMAILLAVSLAVVGLWWRDRRQGVGAPGTIVLADPAVVTDSLTFFADPVVDSLRRTGTPIHLLLPGLPRLGSGPLEAIAPVGGLWSRLVEVDQSVPNSADFLVIASPLAGALGGARPDLSRLVQWHGITSRGAEPNATSLNNRSATELLLEVVEDQHDTQEYPAAVAAFTAAVETTGGVDLITTVLHPDSSLGGTHPPDIIVWLSDQSVSSRVTEMVRQGATLIEFTAHDAGTAENLLLVAAAGVGPPLTRQMMRLGAEAGGAPLLTDQFGRVIVSVAQRGLGRHYRIATRLDPAWSDLALGPALPELAYWIVTGQADLAAAAQVSPAQAAPTGLSPDLPGSSPPRPLARGLLLLAGLLLFAERLVVHALRRTAPA